MPLYTYIMSYNSKFKVSQFTTSNYTGFLLKPIAEAFPELKPVYGELMRMRPEPVSNASRTWRCTLDISGKAFEMCIVETRN